MSVKLNEEQLVILKGMMEYAQSFADAMYKVMVNHGLDKIDGCSLMVNVDPEYPNSTETIYLGTCTDTEFGKMRMEKGKIDKKFVPVGKNSAEYELLFASDELREVMRKVLNAEKETPPDGLWV